MIRVWSHIQERRGNDLATRRKLVLLILLNASLLRRKHIYLRLTVVGTSIRGVAWLTIAVGFFNVWAAQSIVVAHREHRLLTRVLIGTIPLISLKIRTHHGIALLLRTGNLDSVRSSIGGVDFLIFDDLRIYSAFTILLTFALLIVQLFFARKW